MRRPATGSARGRSAGTTRAVRRPGPRRRRTSSWCNRPPATGCTPRRAHAAARARCDGRHRRRWRTGWPYRPGRRRQSARWTATWGLQTKDIRTSRPDRQSRTTASVSQCRPRSWRGGVSQGDLQCLDWPCHIPPALVSGLALASSQLTRRIGP
ncbi:hypothetical protein D3C72_1161800 [compost metagenome]